jgi:hypothetical protein
MNLDIDPRTLTAAQKVEFDRLLRSEIKQATFDSPEWRIDNLYWIQDEHGKEVPFRRNEAQCRWWNERHYLNVILKARQLGFSTEIALEILDECLFISNFRAGIIDYSLEDAKKKLDKIKFAYARLPPSVRRKHPLVRENTETLEFANGSRIEVGTSHRGGTLQHLHVSEYGKTSATRPDKAKEIKTGAFGTVHVGHRVDVESTAEGIGGEFHDMVNRADALQKEGRALSELDFKLHFFAWWQHRGYRIDPNKVRVPIEVEEYFETLKADHGITCDRDQVAWYAAKRYQIGPDNMFREYPSFPEEAFKSSIEGAYFKRQMSRIRQSGRICHLPHDEGRLVNTFWDIGNDTTAIWFHQTDGLRHRLIDYYENQDESITHYVHELQERRERYGWTFGKHYGPHDLDVTEWGGSGKSRRKIAKEAGLDFTVIPRIDDKNDAIDVARQFLGMCWFDEKRCELGIQRLDNYRKKWNEQLGTFSREPLHDINSHGADSLMTGAMGYRPPKEKKPEKIPLPVLDAGKGTATGVGWMMK